MKMSSSQLARQRAESARKEGRRPQEDPGGAQYIKGRVLISIKSFPEKIRRKD